MKPIEKPSTTQSGVLQRFHGVWPQNLGHDSTDAQINFRRIGAHLKIRLQDNLPERQKLDLPTDNAREAVPPRSSVDRHEVISLVIIMSRHPRIMHGHFLLLLSTSYILDWSIISYSQYAPIPATENRRVHNGRGGFRFGACSATADDSPLFRVKHQRDAEPILHPRPAFRVRRNVNRLELAAAREQVFRCFRALAAHRHRGRSVKPSRENPSNPPVKTHQTLPWRLHLFIRYAILRA